MRKYVLYLALVVLCVFSAPAIANGTYTYQPDPSNLYNLDHAWYYTWGIDLKSKGFTQGEVITEATLTFNHIRNWDNNPNMSYIHLLDNIGQSSSLVRAEDNQGAYDYTFDDEFSGDGVLIDNWTTNITPVDKVYTFSTYDPPGHEDLLAVLNNYASDTYIAFAVDPDCHYWNCGVDFTITTRPIPAPGAVMLGGIGIGLVGWLRRRKTL